MKNRKTLKSICYVGFMMLIVGSTSFSNHPRWGDVAVLIGIAIILSVKIILWKNRTKTI